MKFFEYRLIFKDQCKNIVPAGRFTSGQAARAAFEAFDPPTEGVLFLFRHTIKDFDVKTRQLGKRKVAPSQAPKGV